MTHVLPIKKLSIKPALKADSLVLFHVVLKKYTEGIKIALLLWQQSIQIVHVRKI